MKTILIERDYGDKQTLDTFQVIDVDGSVIMNVKALELPWKDNQHDISCIPEGEYEGEIYDSPTKGTVILIKDVPNRKYIEIHIGNYYTDILGCIIVGDKFKDINHDGLKDVVNSDKTFKKLLNHIDNKVLIKIKRR